MQNSKEVNEKINGSFTAWRSLCCVLFGVVFLLAGCADYDVPDARNVNVPLPMMPDSKPEAVNLKKDPIQYVALSEDVLRPKATMEDPLPQATVGPFELRSETLAAALQLILADFDIPLAFETEEALSRRVTIANLQGDLSKVVSRVCGLVDLYCAYEDGLMIVKAEENFAVTLPPIGSDLYDGISEGLQSITGNEVIVDTTTRTMLYTATHRTAERAKYYFERLRANTALIVFETHIWEVTLQANNDTGINWDQFQLLTGNYTIDLTKSASNIAGAVGVGIDFSTPNFNVESVVEFLSSQGAVKVISQPQITLLSGSEAELNIGGQRDYVSEITRSESGDNDDLSLSTSTLETGLGMTITGYLDEATVYGNLEIEMRELVILREVSAGGTQIQLPEITERTLKTQIRIRPGDALLIGGIVTERDDYEGTGPGLMEPLFKTGHSAATRNSELVFLLRPRVIVYGDVPESKKVPLPAAAEKMLEKPIVQPIAQAPSVDASERVEALNATIQAMQSEMNVLKQHALQGKTEQQTLEEQRLRTQLIASQNEITYLGDRLRELEHTQKQSLTKSDMQAKQDIVGLQQKLNLLESQLQEEKNRTIVLQQQAHQKMNGLESKLQQEQSRTMMLQQQAQEQLTGIESRLQQEQERAMMLQQKAHTEALQKQRALEQLRQTQYEMEQRQQEIDARLKDQAKTQAKTMPTPITPVQQTAQPVLSVPTMPENLMAAPKQGTTQSNDVPNNDVIDTMPVDYLNGISLDALMPSSNEEGM